MEQKRNPWRGVDISFYKVKIGCVFRKNQGGESHALREYQSQKHKRKEKEKRKEKAKKERKKGREGKS